MRIAQGRAAARRGLQIEPNITPLTRRCARAADRLHGIVATGQRVGTVDTAPGAAQADGAPPEYRARYSADGRVTINKQPVARGS